MRNRFIVVGIFIAIIFAFYWLFPDARLQSPAPSPQPSPTVIAS